MTIRTGRLIGIMYAVGSTIEPWIEDARRLDPTSLRSGAVRGPRPFTRWQLTQPPFPSNSVRPRVASPTLTARALTSNPARINATNPVSSVWDNLNDCIAVPGMPFEITRTRSSSDDALRKRPRRRSTVPTPSPVAAWQLAQFARYTSAPAATSAWLYSPG